MDNRLNFFNYLIFLFFIIIVFFNFSTKENITIKKTKDLLKQSYIEKLKGVNNSEKKTINPVLDFNDLLEIKEKFEKSKKNESFKEKNFKITPILVEKKKKPLPELILKNKKTEEKLFFSNYKPLEKKLIKNNKNINTSFQQSQKAISIGKLILTNKSQFDISFKWPLKKNMHNLIYDKMLSCLNVQSVILGNDGNFYTLKGIIDEIKVRNNYSPILRLPNYSSVHLETNIVNNIKKKYSKAAKGKLLRLFDTNVDAYILGNLKLLAKSRTLNFRKISGVYSIFNNKLILTNLSVNDVNVDGKIDLSNLNKGC